MSLEEEVEKVRRFAEENPELQAQISASLWSLLVRLRRMSQSPEFEGTAVPEFDYTRIPAWEWLEDYFDGDATQEAVTGLAQSCALELDIPLGRNELRRFDLLVAWFNDHLGEVSEAVTLGKI
jgi:hypothetical protein